MAIRPSVVMFVYYNSIIYSIFSTYVCTMNKVNKYKLKLRWFIMIDTLAKILTMYCIITSTHIYAYVKHILDCVRVTFTWYELDNNFNVITHYYSMSEQVEINCNSYKLLLTPNFTGPAGNLLTCLNFISTETSLKLNAHS